MNKMGLSRLVPALLAFAAVLLLAPSLAHASEADLVIPDFAKEKFLGANGVVAFEALLGIQLPDVSYDFCCRIAITKFFR